MTPKEKAEELFTNYRFLLSIPNAPLGESKDNIAKQCALIAIDEIIHNNNEINGPGDGWIYVEENTDYWKQVKEEINKL